MFHKQIFKVNTLFNIALFLSKEINVTLNIFLEIGGNVYWVVEKRYYDLRYFASINKTTAPEIKVKMILKQ